jgi:hypothetical protein
MKLEMSVFSSDPMREEDWAFQIREALQGYLDVTVSLGSALQEVGQMILVDGTDHLSGFESSRKMIDHIYSRWGRSGRVLFLVVDADILGFPELLLERKVDDVILRPFRPLELLSKIQNYEQILLWAEVSQMNASFTELLQHFQLDLNLAERLQKSKLPVRFELIKGVDIAHRYLVGMRAGGDYFDLAETADESTLSWVLSNSSSYGLSNAILSVLMRVCVKMAVDQLDRPNSTAEVVRRIYDEVQLTLGQGESFSICFAALSRLKGILRVTHLGDGLLFYAAPGDPFERCPIQGGVISHEGIVPELQEHQIQLRPQGRLVLISGGGVELLGGPESVATVLALYRSRASVDLVNEITYQIKSKTGDGELPHRDCTVVALDVRTEGGLKLVKSVTRGQDGSET